MKRRSGIHPTGRLRRLSLLLDEVSDQLNNIADQIKDWQDIERIYTPAERQLDVRLDRRFVLA